MDKCNDHSGCLADIAQLKRDRDDMRERMDAIMTRLNVILGGIVVACAALIGNLVVGMAKL